MSGCRPLKLTVDGKELKAREGETLLEVARENGIYIPTLCYNSAVAPYGACRLCLVEIEKKGRKRLVVSCLYPAEDGLVVRTDAPDVVQTRKIIAELLLARCPGDEAVMKMARSLGVEREPRFNKDDEHCVLCGLCTRACSEIVGVGAITLSNRGTARVMEPPFKERSASCIGCATCVYICPTDCILLDNIKPSSPVHPVRSRYNFTPCSICQEMPLEPVFYELKRDSR